MVDRFDCRRSDCCGMEKCDDGDYVLEEDYARLELWKWRENSDDGSHYNNDLTEICKRVGMALGYDSLRLRQAMATAMYNVLEGEG